MTSLAPPPEAQLIGDRRRSRMPKLSMREAARRAGISPAYWRMLETGVRRVKGQEFPERASDETLAKMAYVVGVEPGELRDVKRPEAAAVLEAILASPPDPVGQLVQAVRGSAEFTEQQKREIIKYMRGE